MPLTNPFFYPKAQTQSDPKLKDWVWYICPHYLTCKCLLRHAFSEAKKINQNLHIGSLSMWKPLSYLADIQSMTPLG